MAHPDLIPFLLTDRSPCQDPWVRTHLAAVGQGVEGIVVAHEHDDRLRYAAAALPGLTILTYTVTFHLTPMPELAR